MMEVSEKSAAGDKYTAPALGSPSGRSEKMGYHTSPHAPNTPENNVCKLVTYRAAKVASFTVGGRELICLPQAFELFLKHLVGGLHTVYTKLKRLEITPVVCNVEQVRILRGVAAIQPGVNRCKLISPQEFDVLYEDCTSNSARPGRPPKRSSYISELSNDDCTTPNKLMRKDLDSVISGIYPPYDELKNLSPTSVVPNSFLPQFPPSSMANLPSLIPNSTVSYPHLNWIQQAALQMAVANQIQSNLSRQSMDPLLQQQLTLLKPTMPLHPLAAHPLTSSHPPTSQQQNVINNNYNEGNVRDEVTSEKGGSFKPYAGLEKSMKSTNFNSENTSEPTTHNVISMPPQPSHDSLPTPPLSSPTNNAEEPQLSVEDSDDEEDSTALLLDKNSASRDETSKLQTSGGNSVDQPLPSDSEHPSHDQQEVDDLLNNLVNELKSFVGTVLEQQKNIISYIEDVRDGLKKKGVRSDLLEVITQCQQETSQYLRRQLSIYSSEHSIRDTKSRPPIHDS